MRGLPSLQGVCLLSCNSMPTCRLSLTVNTHSILLQKAPQSPDPVQMVLLCRLKFLVEPFRKTLKVTLLLTVGV